MRDTSPLRRPRTALRIRISLCVTAGLTALGTVACTPAASAAGSQVGSLGSALVPPGSVASYVVLQPDGQPSVFEKGPGGSLWNYWYANGSWASSELLSGGVSSTPTVILQSNGSPSVFFEGAGGSLWNYWYANGSWGAAQIAPSGVASTPVVGVQNNGAPTIFVQASDGSLLNYFYVALLGRWGAGQVAPSGTTFSSPAVFPQPAAGGAPSVFVQGPGNSLMNYWYIPSLGTWGAATVASTGSAFSAPAVMQQQGASGVPSVFVEGPGGSLFNFWYVPQQGTWGAATIESGGADATTPGLTSQPNGSPSVFFQGSDGSLWNYWYVNGTWAGAQPSDPPVSVPAGAPYLTYSATLREGGTGSGYAAYINARDDQSDAIGVGIQTDNSDASLHGQAWYIWELVQNGAFSYSYITPAPAGNDPVTLEWWPASQTAVFFAGSTPIADITGVNLKFSPSTGHPLYFGVEGDGRQNGDTVNDAIDNTQINVPGGLGAWNDTQFNSYGIVAHDTNGQPQNGANFTVTGTVSGDPSNWGTLPMPAGVALIAQG